MGRDIDRETRERAEEIWREEGQPHGRDADYRGRGTAALDEEDEAVIRANEAAQSEAGGGSGGDPDVAAGEEALGARLGSTDSAHRAVEPLTESDSDDTGESAATNRYAKS